jgi:class 3 adenylate cyclase
VNGYAIATDGAYIAYQTLGEGPVDVVWQFDWFSNVDLIWEFADDREWLRGLASFSRLILHDRRATGASSRNVPAPDLETRVADLLVVLDAVGADRPVVLGGQFEGGAPNALLAATQPDRVRSLIWLSPTARSTWTPDYPWGVRPDYVEAEAKATATWGTAEYGCAFMSYTGNEALGSDIAERLGRFSRQMCTPDTARALADIWYQTDVRGVLPAVQAPALLIANTGSVSDIDEVAYIAGLMQHAEIVEVAGDGPVGTVGGPEHLDAVRYFLGVNARRPTLDRVLTTVLFTDIVDSTSRAATLGDSAWRVLRERHDELVRANLASYQGREVNTMGDGFLATFDGPSRAVRCALAIVEGVADIGVEVRAGLHTGEIELDGDDISGIAVAIGARVGAIAQPSEVLVSQTIKDLTAGSGIAFDDRGEHELKGVPDRWHLYQAIS